jgi:hypothetical protein
VRWPVSEPSARSHLTSPLVNIALALNLSPNELCAYKAYVAMNGPSQASVDWNTNATGLDTSGVTILPPFFHFSHLRDFMCP